MIRLLCYYNLDFNTTSPSQSFLARYRDFDSTRHLILGVSYSVHVAPTRELIGSTSRNKSKPGVIGFDVDLDPRFFQHPYSNRPPLPTFPALSVLEPHRMHIHGSIYNTPVIHALADFDYIRELISRRAVCIPHPSQSIYIVQIPSGILHRTRLRGSRFPGELPSGVLNQYKSREGRSRESEVRANGIGTWRHKGGLAAISACFRVRVQACADGTAQFCGPRLGWAGV
ncbi:hypothetical protein B0H11DRAFT_2369577 [Mycena galericulata]|nr:hypothetical protein B0H11DRAFT_2369577 [Mycena galericulata]